MTGQSSKDAISCLLSNQTHPTDTAGIVVLFALG
jgi:hypothetical protein